MKKIIRLLQADLRMILREQMLWFMLFVVPALQYGMARFGLPWLESRFPFLEEFHWLILMLMILQIVSSIGFVIASMLLDERDEGVLDAIRALPLGWGWFVFYRLFFGTVVSFLFGYALLITAVDGIPAGYTGLVAGLFALTAPVAVLALSSFSRNKVEGLAVYKGLSLLLLLPAFGFFIPEYWSRTLAFIPVYWVLQYVDALQAGQPAGLSLSLALLSHLLLMAGLLWLFRRRVFS